MSCTSRRQHQARQPCPDVRLSCRQLSNPSTDVKASSFSPGAIISAQARIASRCCETITSVASISNITAVSPPPGRHWVTLLSGTSLRDLCATTRCLAAEALLARMGTRDVVSNTPTPSFGCRRSHGGLAIMTSPRFIRMNCSPDHPVDLYPYVRINTRHSSPWPSNHVLGFSRSCLSWDSTGLRQNDQLLHHWCILCHQ